MYRDDQNTPGPSRLSRRMTIIGGMSLLLFGVVFFRLWYLQVLSGDRYLDEARNNQVRDIRTQAPRGEILDRNGKILVGNRTALALQIEPTLLPGQGVERAAELKALGPVAGMSPRQIEAAIRASVAKIPAGPVTLRRGVSQDRVFYLQENQSRFPGVEIQRVFVRRFDQGKLAAQLFGNVGEVTAEQLKQPGYQRLLPGDTVGQSGLEFTYDRFVRGQAGVKKIQVDARGRPKGQISAQPAVPGNTLQLSIDADVQRAGEQAMALHQLPGGFVAMDIATGNVIALGSYPTFDPSIFTKPITPKQYKKLTSKKTGAPLFNRAIAGAYPTGSTFKPITAIAALQSGLITPKTTIVDSGKIKVGELEFKNSGGGVGFGPIMLPTALKVSSDVFFYILGSRLESKNEVIQKWAARLGLGARTGIDLPSEAAGLIPTPEWRNKLFKAGLTDRPWSVGDNINLAVGQGDLQADPLQMAVAYAGLFNGGEVPVPHIGDQVEDAAGRVLKEVRPAPRRKLTFKPAYAKAILDGMHLAAQSPGGTSFPVFGNFPIQIAGKTGTAERPGQADQAWYVAVAPYDHPRIVIALTIEKGGFGVDTAAPAVQRMLAAYFHVKPGTPAANPTAPAPPTAAAAPTTGAARQE